MITKKERRIKIKHRIRKKVNGTASRPRLTVFRSNKAIYAQVVNDLEGKTLVFAGSKGITEGTKTEVAKKVGQAVDGLDAPRVEREAARPFVDGRIVRRKRQLH